MSMRMPFNDIFSYTIYQNLKFMTILMYFNVFYNEFSYEIKASSLTTKVKDVILNLLDM